MKTLALNEDAWDLVLDSEGSIAAIDNTQSVLQDVASSVRVWLGECYYDTDKGVNYWQFFDGDAPISFFIDEATEQALNVHDVESCDIILAPPQATRILQGKILITLTSGKIIEADL